MTLPNTPPSPPAATSPLSTVPVETLRQTFFERVLVHLTSPMDLLPTLERAFPVPATWPETLNQLDDLKQCLDSFRPLNPAQLEKLQAAWDTEYTYESNRIEGNTLTLSETHLVINEGITVGGKTLNEHLEAINHKEAVAYLRELASGETDLSEWVIRSLHELILKNGPHHDERGRYRSVPVSITGTTYVPPQPWQVPKLMEELILQYQEQKEREHPVALAADMHADLVGIHPFIDGNGRTSRLVMNLLLLRAGFPIANISGERSARADYYDTLNASHINHEAEPFRWLVARHVRESLFRYLAMVSGDMNSDRQGKGRYFFERLDTLS
ncbi:MAG: Fic family protein [Candidatus Saccharimonadales bacterium]